ncbi:MAG: multifunctional CCA addition/repair protein [Sterolibacteriaceae bacterium]|nr:multifunctional CCA addition/repair protein [Candidatus Methylophosphatis haderslevensis]
MQIYTVGGAVRDELLGLPVADRDHVVVGATPEQLLELGYRPVGRDFPVFLHPQTHEEYALARTERKSAPGYTGFVVHAAPEVTLEQDLARRDLTINAMARDASGIVIDPYNGRRDLADRVLRHVGPAFVEDPVRILRLARFAARFGDFTVAPETLDLMRTMVAAGEVDALVPERVWQELARGLMEPLPSRMLEVLWSCGALERLLPEVDRLFGVPQPAQHHPEIDTGVHVLLAVDAAARHGFGLTVRFAVLLHDLGKGLTETGQWPHHHGHEERGVELARAVCARLKVPTDCRDLALLAAREHSNIHRAGELKPTTVVKLIERCDGLRRPERFVELVDACACDFHGRAGNQAQHYASRDILLGALGAVRDVDAGAIARQAGDPAQIAARLHEARVAAVKALAA